MSFCRSWTPLSATTEPASGKVQCLLASRPDQLWLAYLIPSYFRGSGRVASELKMQGFVCVLVFLGVFFLFWFL